jgi:hypothetical protein
MLQILSFYRTLCFCSYNCPNIYIDLSQFSSFFFFLYSFPSFGPIPGPNATTLSYYQCIGASPRGIHDQVAQLSVSVSYSHSSPSPKSPHQIRTEPPVTLLPVLWARDLLLWDRSSSSRGVHYVVRREAESNPAAEAGPVTGGGRCCGCSAVAVLQPTNRSCEPRPSRGGQPSRLRALLRLDLQGVKLTQGHSFLVVLVPRGPRQMASGGPRAEPLFGR